MNRPVFGIPVSFSSEENINVLSTISYCQYLISNGADRLMTTAGTSSFNLLSKEEVHMLNIAISKLPCETFLGLPEMSLYHTLELIKKCNDDYYNNSKLLLLFPERHYSDMQVIDYFEAAADASRFPVYIHGKTIRKASGGSYNYCQKVINTLSSHHNICGIKEEHPNLNQSFNEITRFHSEFETIVAGGSMRRFMFLNAAGASTFLTGAGNILPQIALDFCDAIDNNNLLKANKIIVRYETPLFATFMKLGWHRGLRNALNLMGFDYSCVRRPFCFDIDKKETEQVQACVNNIIGYKNEK